jgi:stage II sporulation protein Q
MKKRKLKGFVLPTAYVIGVTMLFLGIMYIGSNLNTSYLGDYNFVTSLFTDNLNSVVSIDDEEKISKPFDNENVTISKYFYDKDADDTNKESSIIYYENTYMQNTGVLYSSDEQFDVLASLSGTVTNITDDDILGKVVYVEYNTKLTIVYYSLESTDLKIGDQIEQNAVIGKSGSNKLENEKKYSLLIEVYMDGNLINPLDFYEMNITDLNN